MIKDGGTEHDIDTLARTIWGEARGETFQGKVAVGWTIINRAKRGGWWGENITEVCLKPRQYSCWNLDDPNRRKLLAVTPDDPVFAECLGIAALLVARANGRTGLPADFLDPTVNSTHYCVSTLSPYWAQGKSPVAKIGAHSFFNDIG